MCGITGFFNSKLAAEQKPQLIQAMLHLIAHRGPDEMGYYSDENVTFGNTRLSIVDIQSGQQPLCDSTGRYWICFNGEIYNYQALAQELIQQGVQFRTHADTEVALYAWIVWGPQAFERLNGAFGLAIYDKVAKTLVLARDRYGKRPLYYYRQQDELLFASELKCFLAYPNISFEFDQAKLASILYLWTPLPDETAFKNFQQVPEGCYLIASNQHFAIHRYGQLNFETTAFNGSEQAAAAKVRSLLQESVRLRMNCDVEVGVYLSGGLDSAIVAYLAASQSKQALHSFSIAFEEQDFDESSKQQLLSQHLGTRHTTLRVSNADIATAFPAAVWHAEVPQFRTALVPMYLLAQRVQQQGIKVVLTGEGADEAFLGYDFFKETVLRQLLQQNPDSEQIYTILKHLYPYLHHYQSDNYKSLLRVYQQHLNEQTPGLFSHELRFHNSKFAMRLLNTSADPLASIKQLLQARQGEYQALTRVQQTQWLEFQTLLAGYLLSSQGDRMSLAHGVEGRCPFLDVNVVQFAANLPQAYHLKNGYQEKNLLKLAFAADLPASILQQPKQPYRAPDAIAFLRESAPDYLELILSAQHLSKIDGLNVPFCQQLVKKLQTSSAASISPRENQAFIQLLSLSFLQHYFIKRNYPKPVISPPLAVNVSVHSS